MARPLSSITRRGALGLSVAAAIGAVPRVSGAAPQGELRIASHVSLAPTWFDPAETAGIITPFMMLYAMHDAMMKAMPDDQMAPCLAESWKMAPDGLSYAFTLRKDVLFHNGEPLTADDVKFSLERYRGSSSKTLKERVAGVDIHDQHRLTIRLNEPWPDFLTFYAGATGAGWIVPRKYVQQVGEDGFKKAPVGAGPYKFVSFTPGVELVCEAFEGYWRKPPAVKRLVFKVVPDEATRLAALQRGEVDIAYSIRGELADELTRTPGLALKAAVGSATFWLYFADQWDAQSPWHDQRVRLAANLALDHKTINQALTLGYSRLTNSVFPENFDYYWQPPDPVYEAARARKLLAEAGHARGFDAGDYYCDASYANIAEVVLNNLREVGIRVKLRPLERAAFFKAYSERKLKNIVQGASGAFGNCATRAESFVVKGGAYVYGNYPDIDELFQQQATELDGKKREAILHKAQQLVHERTIYAHLWQLAFINGAGPRVGESGLGLIPGHAYSAPYEDVTLAGK